MMSIKGLFNCFLVYFCSKISHQFPGVGCLTCMCLSWLLWILLSDIGISYQLLLRHTHCYSYGLLARKNFSIIIPHGFRFFSRSFRLEPRRLNFSLAPLWENFQPDVKCFKVCFSTGGHHSLFSSSRTPGSSAMIVCHIKHPTWLTSCKWLTEVSCSFVAPTLSTNSELIRSVNL